VVVPERSRVEQVEDLVAQFTPEDVEQLVSRTTVLARLVLVPAYRHSTLLGIRQGCFYPYNVLASGSGRTDHRGQAVIPLGAMLGCIGASEPVHHGMRRASGDTLSRDLLMTGSPATVVTAASAEPVIMTASSEQLPPFRPLADSGSVPLSWNSPIPSTGASNFDEMRVGVRSFTAAGGVAERVAFAWHSTIECVFRHSIA